MAFIAYVVSVHKNTEKVESWDVAPSEYDNLVAMLSHRFGVALTFEEIEVLALATSNLYGTVETAYNFLQSGQITRDTYLDVRNKTLNTIRLQCGYAVKLPLTASYKDCWFCILKASTTYIVDMLPAAAPAFIDLE